jgi:hypothetical protein
MPTYPVKIISLFIALIALVGMSCDLGALIPSDVQFGQPEPSRQTIFKGIVYERIIRQDPRPMVIHVVTIDLKAEGISVLVTPGEAGSSQPLTARTTSDFLSDFNMSLAINGDAFEPWNDYGPLGFSPHAGDTVSPIGFAASRGVIYSEDTDEEPTLYIYQTNKASIDALIGKIYNAISGNELLIKNGELAEDLLASETNPRTAVGLNRAGSKLIIIIVDGRQTGYSEGATLHELAALFLENGAFRAINLDGGGSTTLVMEGSDSQPLLLNSPVHGGNPGTERPVGNHLGISAK